MLQALAGVAVALVLAAASPPAGAQEARFFQLGAGPTGELRFPLAGLIANALSNPPGSRPCDKGGSCGVPGLVAVARSTTGSVANVEALRAGRLDAALVQADVAAWAYHGTGLYKRKGAVKALRGIAMLYPETLQLVARRDSGIRRVADLKGKRVSFGTRESLTLVQGRLLLAAWGLGERQVRLSYLAPSPAAEALGRGELDAVLVIDAHPVPAVAALARAAPVALVPLDGPEADRLRARHPFLTAATIPAGTYAGMAAPVATLSVGVAMVTRADQPAELVRGITRALWHPATRTLLAQGLPRAATALDAGAIVRLGIPLHDGAAAYYAEAGRPADGR